MTELEFVDIYTDGGCKGNPGPGAWAYIILKDNKIIKKNTGYKEYTTNNIMELTAVIEALKNCDFPNINIYTDSTYVKNGITIWINNWIKNNWKNSQKKPVKNRELWEELLFYSNTKNIKWHWVKAHSTNELNNLVDKILNETIKLNSLKKGR